MIRINLLPDIKRDFLKARHDQARVVGFSILSLIVAGGITAVLAFWVYAVQNIHINLLTDSIKDKNSEIQQIKDIDKYVTVQNQLANLSSLHENKNNLARLLEFLPMLNPRSPNTIQLTQVSLDDTTSTIRLQGQTADFTGLITFRDILQNADVEYRSDDDASTAAIKEKLFSDVVIAEQGMAKLTTGERVVTFTITAAYNSAVFRASSKDVIVSVPKLETTPSKQDSPDIFSPSDAVDNTAGEGN